ncbi:complex I assembly factor ACAD9, mitochondrial [Wyeomyia smithii]|uniref:complex I assembly factor ACAD9, mitochondrial n=1 Tax=Wyeomyia smithii TaxID=174621 RepID=UPI002467D70F|nr:complex I assembly factor ACAD9, mitochondrial [Wyeomyia smithii]
MLFIKRVVISRFQVHNRPFSLAFTEKKSKTTPSFKPSEDLHEDPKSEIKINTKPAHQRLDKREPFMKNMFIGKVDTDLLVYPESLNRDEQSRLISERKNLEKSIHSLTKDSHHQNKEIFGLRSPLHLGGKQLIETELAYFNELISADITTAIVSGQHNAVVEILNKFASDRLKSKCLEDLSSGSKIATFALFEEEAPNNTMFSTLANPTGNGWLLNGSKSFIINGDKSSYLLVLASTKTVELMNNQDTTITAFLVDVNATGVHQCSTDETLGLSSIKQTTFKFENVELSTDDIIGMEGSGAQVLVELLKTTRIQTSVLGVQIMKQIFNQITKHCIETKTGAGYVLDIENVREEVSRSLCSIYAAESMIYLTTGLLDDFVCQDAEMEVALTKIFTNERLLQLALVPLRFIGPHVLVKRNSFEPMIRDAMQLFGHGETMDSVKYFVSLSGMQHAGMSTYETIKKDRNPAMNPSHVLSKLFEKNTIETPKKIVNMEHYFHPSLEPAANRIELSIMRLKLATECTLSRHGLEVINRHIELVRLADIAVLIYAMLAATSRASRSYCIGLAHGDQEVHLANTFSHEASETVLRLARNLEAGQFITNDSNYDAMARYLFRQKQYFFEHPLNKNF